MISFHQVLYAMLYLFVQVYLWCHTHTHTHMILSHVMVTTDAQNWLELALKNERHPPNNYEYGSGFPLFYCDFVIVYFATECPSTSQFTMNNNKTKQKSMCMSWMIWFSIHFSMGRIPVYEHMDGDQFYIYDWSIQRPIKSKNINK